MTSTRVATPPAAPYALLGGSGTGTMGAPDQDPRVTVVGRDMVVSTPFGDSPPLALMQVPAVDGTARQVLYVRPHFKPSERPSVWTMQERAQTMLALFWSLQRAGVDRIITESGAASITQHFHPRDLVVPNDFIDFTAQFSGRLEPDRVLSMRQPFCPDVRDALWQRSRQFAADKATRAFNRAVHVSVEGPRFETASEVLALARMGGDVIGQTISPEVYLAREIGACFGAVQMVLNYAEGVRPEWDFELIREVVREGAEELGTVALDALIALPAEHTCSCSEFRPQMTANEAGVADTA